MTGRRQKASVAPGFILKTTTTITIAVFGFIIALANIGHAMYTSEIGPESALAGPIYELGARLMAALNNNDGQANIIMSPISIHQALSMVLMGTDNGTQTERELLDSIGYTQMSKTEIEQRHRAYARLMSEFETTTKQSLADRERAASQKNQAEHRASGPIIDLFTMMVTKNKGEVDPNYANNIQKYFHSSIRSIDDERPQTKADLLKCLNDWGKEAEFESPIMTADNLEQDFGAILISAIRLEAFWSDYFIEDRGDKIFYNYGSKNQPVGGDYLFSRDFSSSQYMEFTSSERAQVRRLHDLMSKDESFVALSKLNFRAMEISLIGDLSFVIIEPLDSSSPDKPNESLNRLVEELTANIDTQSGSSNQGERPMTKLAKALELLDRREAMDHVDYLQMPKFKFESDIDLKSALQSIGIRRGFDRTRAEISNIMSNKLFIDDIKHKAVIETTKIGIKAAGVTIVRLGLLSAMITERKIEVVIENPFMFIVRYRNIPLFVGQLTNL